METVWIMGVVWRLCLGDIGIMENKMEAAI